MSMKNKKILYVNGCSHSCGAEISYVGSMREPNDIKKSWGGYISRHYNLTHHNDAISGASNYGIYSNTVHSILKLLEIYSPDEIIVIIGWSSFDRHEYIYENTLYRFVPSCDQLPHFKKWPSQVQTAFKNFILSTEHYNDSMNKFSLIYFNTATFLKSLGIKYQFFNAIQHVCVPTVNLLHEVNRNIPTYNIFDLIKNDQNYLSPFDHDMTYFNYLKKYFDCFYEGRNHHFLEDAQQHWAKILIEKIETINYEE